MHQRVKKQDMLRRIIGGAPKEQGNYGIKT